MSPPTVIDLPLPPFSLQFPSVSTSRKSQLIYDRKTSFFFLPFFTHKRKSIYVSLMNFCEVEILLCPSLISFQTENIVKSKTPSEREMEKGFFLQQFSIAELKGGG